MSDGPSCNRTEANETGCTSVKVALCLSHWKPTHPGVPFESVCIVWRVYIIHRGPMSLCNVASECFSTSDPPSTPLSSSVWRLCFRGADVAGLHASALFVLTLSIAVIITWDATLGEIATNCISVSLILTCRQISLNVSSLYASLETHVQYATFKKKPVLLSLYRATEWMIHLGTMPEADAWQIAKLHNCSKAEARLHYHAHIS